MPPKKLTTKPTPPPVAAPVVKVEKPKPKAEPKPKEVKADTEIYNYNSRIPAVDKKFYDTKTEALKSEIEILKKKSAAITQVISDKSGGKDEFVRQRDELKSKIDNCQTMINDFENQKQLCNDNIQSKQVEGKKMFSEIKTMQKKIGFQSEEEIDKQIAEIEMIIHTATMDLKMEKAFIAKIAHLKSTKPQLATLKKKSAILTANDNPNSVGPLKLEISEIQAKISEARDERKKYSASLAKISAIRKESMDGLSEYFSERDELNDLINAKYIEMKAIWNEKSAKLKAFNDYIQAQNELRAQREHAENEVYNAEEEVKKLKAESDKEAQVPFQKEIELLENTLLYCQGLLPAPSVSISPNVALNTQILLSSISASETGELLLSKNNRQEDFFIQPTSKKLLKKIAAATNSSPQVVKNNHLITHKLNIISLFDQIQVHVPQLIGDLPDTISVITEKLEAIKALQLSKLKSIEDKKLDKKFELIKKIKEAETKTLEMKECLKAQEAKTAAAAAQAQAVYIPKDIIDVPYKSKSKGKGGEGKGKGINNSTSTAIDTTTNTTTAAASVVKSPATILSTATPVPAGAGKKKGGGKK